MNALNKWLTGICTVALLPACGAYHRAGLDPTQARQVESRLANRVPASLENQILALNPDHVSGSDVRNVLAKAPAPHMVLIHGGLDRVVPNMVSFRDFLVGMGYPAAAIRNPNDGTFTFSSMESADMVAGMIAWYYEKDGLRPMIVGHSQGGFQIIKILNRLDQGPTAKVYVWNPVSWQREDRWQITDPLTGRLRPVAGLRLPYASSVGTGGLTRVLPNQWETIGRLRSIPDTVEEFTGFYSGHDPTGGDFLGYGSANHSRAIGSAKVRNVELPSTYIHGSIPDTRHLARNRQTADWINNYRPPNKSFHVAHLDTSFSSNSDNILWAADVWYSIKKHWVIELQNLIRARRAAAHAR